MKRDLRTTFSTLVRHRGIKRFLIMLLLLGVGYTTYSLSKKAYTLLVISDPSKWYDTEEGPSGELQSIRSEILAKLNEEISQDKKQKLNERFRILAALRSLFRGIQGYAGKTSTEKSAGKNQGRPAELAGASDTPSLARQPQQRDSNATGKGESILLQPILLAKDNRSRQNNVNTLAKTTVPQTRAARTGDQQQPSPLDQNQTEAQLSNPELLAGIQPLEGVSTRGIAWRVNRRIMLEGIFDASSRGETDPDLQDFSFRSMHALAILRQASRPEFLYGHQKIESGFPRSYGIGINFQLNPSMNLIFDYVQEFSNNHYIEYTGSWESSLVTDYSRWRPDETQGRHNFFLGMRYLQRKSDYLVPIHTGFFYTTATTQDPRLQSEVSLGFSLGTGLYLKHLTLGIAYQMRIWETPDTLLYIEGTPGLSQKITNQFLFHASF